MMLDLRCTGCLVLSVIIGLNGGLGSEVASWIEEPSISHFQITSGRLSTVNVNTLQNCIIECYIRPTCVTVGYSDTYEGCQLYNLDLTDFVENTISQSTTHFYKAVCTEPGYSNIRSLGLCIKRHSTTLLPQANASATCTSEGGSLLKIDSSDKGDYLNDILFHIHDQAVGFSYLIGGQWNSSANSWQWKDGSPIDDEHGAMYWLTQVPDNTDGNCLAVQNFGNTIQFNVVDCLTNLMFICSFNSV